MVVEAVLEWVFLAQQIIQLVNWIKTLPAKLQQMLKDCYSSTNRHPLAYEKMIIDKQGQSKSVIDLHLMNKAAAIMILKAKIVLKAD